MFRWKSAAFIGFVAVLALVPLAFMSKSVDEFSHQWNLCRYVAGKDYRFSVYSGQNYRCFVKEYEIPIDWMKDYVIPTE